ncbi:hypothetical protein C9374_005678 [Naegleria lovaniensis]|uniref:Nucleoporin SEH1 n=1 Tax=Naegleria lovaniensis TaxID=51637 RepID=A0AA88GJ01_NAELO|nr:uncharacterized protein C9374_005678 [Naegleria lovaniensis]KAG2381886.1 hypothetical protein C9374_005678 [Naegleria lovaniensis]
MRVVDSFPSTHNYYIHDLKYDFYGERIASCSSDHHIKVWDRVESTTSPNTVIPNIITPSTSTASSTTQKSWKCTYDWKAHNGSIWKVEWAHPEFGQVLASCSYDHTVSIWEEPPANSGPGSGLAPIMISQGIIGNPSKDGVNNQQQVISSNAGGGSLHTSASSGNLQNLPRVSSSTNVQQQDGLSDGNISPSSNMDPNVAVGNGNLMTTSSSNLAQQQQQHIQTNTTAGSSSSSATGTAGPLSRRAWLLKATLVDSTDDVVDIKFAPKHLGLKLATCSLSGKVRIYDAFDVMNLAYWNIGHDFDANNGGKIHCLSWCPYRFKEPMMVIGCEDGKLRIWHYTQNRKWQSWTPSTIIPNIHNISQQLVGFTPGTPIKPISVNEGNASQVLALFGHAQPVHDVAWAPNLGRSYDLIASASKDGSVRIWKIITETKTVELMEMDETHKHNSEVWKVEWNLSGTVLASSGDDGTVRLWKYNFEEKRWKCESVVEGVNKNEN